jgi:hypothetical protein
MDLTAIKAITDGSTTITSWSINIVGGSLAALLSTSYLKPVKGWWKLIYLLFVPGWVFLGLSINSGDMTAREGMVAYLHPEAFEQVVQKMNDSYANQLDSFKYGLIFFGSWLGSYLFWWLISDNKQEE